MYRSLIFLSLLLTGLSAVAQDVVPLTFQSWKEQQILEAQNQTLRVSARISQLKSTPKGAAAGKKDAPAPVLNSKVKKTEEADPLAAAEKELRRNQESLQAAGDLSLEDYVNIYLPTLQDQPEALRALGQKLSKDELAEIFRLLVITRPNLNDAKHNQSALTEAISSGARSKSL